MNTPKRVVGLLLMLLSVLGSVATSFFLFWNITPDSIRNRSFFGFFFYLVCVAGFYVGYGLFLDELDLKNIKANFTESPTINKIQTIAACLFFYMGGSYLLGVLIAIFTPFPDFTVGEKILILGLVVGFGWLLLSIAWSLWNNPRTYDEWESLVNSKENLLRLGGWGLVILGLLYIFGTFIFEEIWADFNLFTLLDYSINAIAGMGLCYGGYVVLKNSNQKTSDLLRSFAFGLGWYVIIVGLIIATSAVVYLFQRNLGMAIVSLVIGGVTCCGGYFIQAYRNVEPV